MPTVALIPKRTITITLHDFEGFEAECAGEVSLAGYSFLNEFAGEKDIEKLKEPLRYFGDNILLSWNGGDANGNELPATGDGVLALPVSIAVALITAWSESLTAVPAPFDGSSTSTDTPDSTSTTTGTR